jgi:hypothetical protein
MQNKKARISEKARLAAQLAQERIDEMAKTNKYQVDKTLQKASRTVRPVTKPGRSPRPAKDG